MTEIASQGPHRRLKVWDFTPAESHNPTDMIPASRFAGKSDKQKRIVAFLEATLLSHEMLDKELCRARPEDETGGTESVLDTALCSPGIGVAGSIHSTIGGNFYDFCYHSKMCSFCGHMAGDNNKLKVCACCKTEHLCDGICQKAHWAAGHKTECGKIHRLRQTLANTCRQIAACMCVWDMPNGSPDLILKTLSSQMEQGGVHDILWLASYQSVDSAVLFSTVSRELLVACVGKPTVDAALEKSGPEQHIVLIVPSKDETGTVVYTAVSTFLRAKYDDDTSAGVG